jgi:ribosomal protein S18 acetylase RimI-like enzyme
MSTRRETTNKPRPRWILPVDRLSKEILMRSEIATVADAALAAELVNAAYRGAGGRCGWTHDAGLIAGDRVSPKGIAAMIRDSSTTVLVRRSDKPPALLGCVAVEMKSADRCTISMLAVTPEHQATGLGRTLLADAERFAASKGATVAKITVLQQRDSLIDWYERRGYRRTGCHEAFPYGDESVGTPLRDDLRFVVLEKTL